MRSRTETFGHLLGLHVSRCQVLLSLGDEKVSLFRIFLLFEVENARIGAIIKINLFVFLLGIIVEICMRVKCTCHVLESDVVVSRRVLSNLRSF